MHVSSADQPVAAPASFLIGLTCSRYQGLRSPIASPTPPDEAWIRAQPTPPHPTLTTKIASIIHQRAVRSAARWNARVRLVIAGQTFCWIVIDSPVPWLNVWGLSNSVRLTSTLIAVRKRLWLGSTRMLSPNAIHAWRHKGEAEFDAVISEAMRWSIYCE